MANENETHEDIIAEMRDTYASKGGAGYCGEVWIDLLRYADRLEAARKRMEWTHKKELETKDAVIQTEVAAREAEREAHKREVDALVRRRNELNAEVAAKDEVIQRLDAEIRKYQEERELGIAAQKAKAAAEGYADGKRDAQVGNAAKLRKALEAVRDAHFVREENGEDCEGFDVEADDGTGRPLICVVEDALAAPARNCDRFNSGDPRKDAAEAWDAYDGWVESYRAQGKTEPFNEFGWLFAPATEQEGGAK